MKFAFTSVVITVLGFSHLVAAENLYLKGLSPESYTQPELHNYRANNGREETVNFPVSQELLGYQVAAYINQVIKPKFEFLLERNALQEKEIISLKQRVSQLDRQLAEQRGR